MKFATNTSHIKSRNQARCSSAASGVDALFSGLQPSSRAETLAFPPGNPATLCLGWMHSRWVGNTEASRQVPGPSRRIPATVARSCSKLKLSPSHALERKQGDFSVRSGSVDPLLSGSRVVWAYPSSLGPGPVRGLPWRHSGPTTAPPPPLSRKLREGRLSDGFPDVRCQVGLGEYLSLGF